MNDDDHVRDKGTDQVVAEQAESYGEEDHGEPSMNSTKDASEMVGGGETADDGSE